MKLSIIVPVYRVEEYLSESIDSILKQTFTDYELILIDDGSPDQCGAICEDYARKDNRIRVIHQANGGLSAARNAGLDVATGEYIAFVDSDDFIASDYFSRAMQAFDTEEEIDMVVMPVQIYYNSTQRRLYNPPIDYTIHGGEEAFATWYNHEGFLYAFAWNKICRRELYHEVRFPAGAYFEDVHTTPRLFKLCRRMKYIQATTEADLTKIPYFYRLRSSSITVNTGYRGHRDALTHQLDLYEMSSQSHLVKKEILMSHYLHLTNVLITLLRCKDSLDEENKAFAQECLVRMKRQTPALHTLCKSTLSLRTKVKNIPLVLLGLQAHCYLYTGKWVKDSSTRKDNL